MTLRRITILAAVVTAATVALAACGNGSHSSESMTTAMGATSDSMSASAGFNTADVAFARGMIPHHQQAVEMADIALDPARGASAKVRELATGIKAAQDPEIKLMTGWMTTWGQPMQMDTAMGRNMSSMDGMMSDQDMVNLHALNGAAFDTMWLQTMIRHHQGAIAAAETIKSAGSSSDVLTLADQVIAAQQAEIGVMKALLAAK